MLRIRRHLFHLLQRGVSFIQLSVLHHLLRETRAFKKGLILST